MLSDKFLLCYFTAHEHYQQIYNKKIPVIFYNNYYKNLKYPHVTVNDKQCSQKLLSLLIKAGHKKIAGIFNYDNYQSVEKLGKNIPDDYSVVCLDYSKDDWKEKGITCSIHQGKTIGEEVAKRLLRMIEAKEMDENTYSCILSPMIYEGESIRHITKKKNNG